MLTVEEFKTRLTQHNSPNWMLVAIDANSINQFYIVVNAGMGNTISTPIEQYPAEIKDCVIHMLSVGELIIDKNKNFLLEINTFVHYLTPISAS